jgi:hypothetical protein
MGWVTHDLRMPQTAAAPSPTSIALPSLPDNWRPYGFAVLSDGALAILGADYDIGAEWRFDEKGSLLGDPHGVARSARARIWVFDGTSLSRGPDFALLTPFPLVDRFPDGRWVVASTRAFQEANGRVLSADGHEIRRIRVGDGIERLKIDDGGRIWVGWFDEGVFGNQGWRVDGVEWPPSSYGLAAFDENGRVVSLAANPSEADDQLADCYALNVVGETAYACTYVEFPIRALSAGSPPRRWNTELSGTRALAVRLPFVLAAGGYAEDGDRVVLIRLGSTAAETVKEWRLPLLLGYQQGLQLVDGRGPVLHVVHDGVWHQWNINHFLADVETRPS